ncbi:MAG: hypothetical protein K2Y18_06545 [Alphaproteobacteria bacterium]|jgi:hypothetical protein|nr:hypothetical protein [Alphaproteobacteria bacterium]
MNVLSFRLILCVITLFVAYTLSTAAMDEELAGGYKGGSESPLKKSRDGDSTEEGKSFGEKGGSGSPLKKSMEAHSPLSPRNSGIRHSGDWRGRHSLSSSGEGFGEENEPHHPIPSIEYAIPAEPPPYNLQNFYPSKVLGAPKSMIKTLKATSVYLLDELIVRDHEDPKGIVVIVDVDGVLTDNQNPKPDDMVNPRRNAIELMRELHRRGFHLIASSAQSDLNHTLNRIRKLGLADIFHVGESTEYSAKIIKIFQEKRFVRSVSVMCLGNVISVHSFSEGSFPSYYRGKALSPLIAFDGKVDFIRRVVFLDDSSNNIIPFEKDVMALHPFGNHPVKVDIIFLGEPSLEP